MLKTTHPSNTLRLTQTDYERRPEMEAASDPEYYKGVHVNLKSDFLNERAYRTYRMLFGMQHTLVVQIWVHHMESSSIWDYRRCKDSIK